MKSPSYKSNYKDLSVQPIRLRCLRSSKVLCKMSLCETAWNKLLLLFLKSDFLESFRYRLCHFFHFCSMDSFILDLCRAENTNAILIFSASQEILQSLNKSGLGELTPPWSILFCFPKKGFSGCPENWLWRVSASQSLYFTSEPVDNMLASKPIRESNEMDSWGFRGDLTRWC